VQAGEFNIGDTGSEVLGEVMMSLRRGETLSAELILEWPGGRTSCETAAEI
jgi:hypothetical protein